LTQIAQHINANYFMMGNNYDFQVGKMLYAAKVG